jgi:hypothetical protein
MEPVLPQCPETENAEFPADCREWFAEPQHRLGIIPTTSHFCASLERQMEGKHLTRYDESSGALGGGGGNSVT